MINHLRSVFPALCVLALFGFGCQSSDTTTARVASPVSTTTSTTTTESATGTPSWVPNNPKGPWNGSIVLATSTDGLTFTSKGTVLKQAGVPNLLRLADGTLVLTYQYFSFKTQDMFDAISYSTSTDNGTTWTEPKGITFSNLPESPDGVKKPMDPTLVQLEDGSLRVYFTYHAKGLAQPALYSATAADGDIASTFVVNTTPALQVDGNLLDPAVVSFNGIWQHYTWQDTSDNNYHSTSTDGLAFTKQTDINLPMDFLGEVVNTGTGLRFYGTGKGGVVSAVSTDGSTWTMEDGVRLQGGADPGVAQLADGSYVMVYTSMNFNQK